jgi:Cu(I)/Ag(I) efflux system membrane fusion protein
MRALGVTLIVAAVAAGAGFAGYRIAMHEMAPAQSVAAKPVQASATERKVLYWYDPMSPQQKFDKPGKSPFMDMQLVPKYAEEAAGAEGQVSISPQVVQNLGIRTAEAKLGTLEPKLEAVGSVGWNERGVALVHTRSAGFVEKLYARTPLDPVARGAPLVEIFFPEWAGAQEEYLLLRSQPAAEAKPLAAAARQRLLLLGMSADDVAPVEREGKVMARFTLRSPISGVIAELGVREGMTVAAGAPLFRIVDLSSVWVSVEVPEAQAAWLVPGSRVEARVPAFPDQAFVGRVGAILPDVNTVTRTLRARIELANPGARLKPGMFATLSLSSGRATQAVLVPSEALIRTGERILVVLADSAGRFRQQEVEVGIESGGSTEIRKGLKAGDKVVLSGQFLIDSEASLRAGLSRMEVPAKPAPVLHKGHGVVTGVSAPDGYLELKHDPIPSMKWGAMQMGFAVTDKKILEGLKKGDEVEFEMRGLPNKDGDFVVERLTRKGKP